MAAAEHHRDAGRGETMSEFGGGGAVALIDGARRTAIDANRSDLPFGINRLWHRAPPPVAARRARARANRIARTGRRRSSATASICPRFRAARAHRAG